MLEVDPYLFPARGRKRPLEPWRAVDNGDVDPYLFPARGRKLLNLVYPTLQVFSVDPYLFPARGRKLYKNELDPSYQPQDG